MDLLADVVRNPAFAAEEIERQKRAGDLVAAGERRRPGLRRRRRCSIGWSTASIRTGCRAAARPRRWPSITRDDLQAFHRQLLRAQQHDPGDRRRRHQRGSVRARPSGCSARWPRGEVPPSKPIEPPPPTRRIVVVDKPDAVQTEIRVGQLAIPRKHPDYLAWDLAVKILGGEGANRLHRVLRSRARADLRRRRPTPRRMKQAGDFVAETDTRTETTGEALRLMVDEFSQAAARSASSSASWPTRRRIWPAASR